MRWSATAAVLLAVLTGIVAQAVPADDVHIEADQGEATGLDEKSPVQFTAEGNVRVQSGTLKLRAPKLTFTKDPRQAILEGGVVGLRGRTVLTAQQLTFDLDARSLALSDGMIVMKGRVQPEELQTLFDSDQPSRVCGAGIDALTLKASRIWQTEGSTFHAQDAFFSTCPCPLYCRHLLSFSASRIDVKPGESATMTSTVIRLFTVPVLWVPWISVPLADRKTGVLFPVASLASPGGLVLGLPLFVTLGRSADLTLTPHYAFGTANSDKGGDGLESLASRGPGADLELRWRPAENASGWGEFAYLYDTSNVSAGDTSPVRGSRGGFTLVHQQPVLGGHLGLSLDAVSDARFLADTAVAPLRRAQNYLRSWAGYSRSLGLTGLSLDTNVIQNLNPVTQPSPSPTDPNSTVATYPRTRFTELPGTIAPVGRMVLGRVWGVSDAVITARIDASQEAVLPYLELNSGHIRRFIAGARLTQTVPLLAGTYGTVSLEGSERAQFVSAGLTSTPGWRAGGYVDLLAQSRLERKFDSGWTHEIRPSLRVRALGVLQEVGDNASVPFSNGLFQVSRSNSSVIDLQPRILQSELDMALPQFGTIQSVARIDTSLTGKEKPTFNLGVEYHSSIDASGGPLPFFNPGQLRANVGFSYKRWLFSADEAYQLGANRRPTSSGASLGIPLPIGTTTLTSFFRYLNGPTDDLISREMDVLFTPPSELPTLPSSQAPAVPQITFGGGLNAVYDSWRLSASAGLTLPTVETAQSGLTQDYRIALSYETESCGRISLTLFWNHVKGAQYLPPIPVPGYEFGGVQKAIAAGVGAAPSPAVH